MVTNDLKIVKTTKDLLWLIIVARKDVPRHISHSLMSRMQDTAERMLNRINYANRAENPQRRIDYLVQLLAEQGTLENYVEFCIEHNLFQGSSRNMPALMLTLVVSIGKQATGWKANAERRLADKPSYGSGAILRT